MCCACNDIVTRNKRDESDSHSKAVSRRRCRFHHPPHALQAVTCSCSWSYSLLPTPYSVSEGFSKAVSVVEFTLEHAHMDATRFSRFPHAGLAVTLFNILPTGLCHSCLHACQVSDVRVFVLISTLLSPHLKVKFKHALLVVSDIRCIPI